MLRASSHFASIPAGASFLAGLLLVSSSALTGCTTTPRLIGQDTEVLHAGRIAAANPADVAIAPVELVYEGMDVPAEQLRASAARALVVRRYSPLALGRVDETVIEAAYSPGALREDAVLHILVHQWDDSLWDTRRALQVEVEARMLDASDPLSEPLWSGRVSERFDLSGEVARATSDVSLMGAATDKIMKELLAVLPARDPQPGPR